MMLILLSIGYVIIYPLMYMISSSFRSSDSYYDPTITWITNQVTVSNYKLAADALDYWNTLKNTVLYELIAGLIQLMVCSVIAYGLARFNFKEKKILMFMLIVIILLPVQMSDLGGGTSRQNNLTSPLLLKLRYNCPLNLVFWSLSACLPLVLQGRFS